MSTTQEMKRSCITVYSLPSPSACGLFLPGFIYFSVFLLPRCKAAPLRRLICLQGDDREENPSVFSVLFLTTVTLIKFELLAQRDSEVTS